jgi:hypothetical protein
MDCQAVTQRLQPLLDDLLQEEEYQAIQSHLRSCATCREHVGAVNSLAHGLEALGAVAPPGDLHEAILFRIAHGGSQAAPSPARAPTASASWIPFAALGVATLVAWMWFYNARIKQAYYGAGGEPPVNVRAYLERPGHTDREAQLALGQLQALARKLGANDSAVAAKGDGSLATPLRWTLRLRPAEQPALLRALFGTGAQLEQQAPGLVLISVLRAGLPDVAHQIQSIPGALQTGDSMNLHAPSGATVWVLIELAGT